MVIVPYEYFLLKVIESFYTEHATNIHKSINGCDKIVVAYLIAGSVK